MKVQLRCIEKGLVASKPTTEARYDLVLDEGGKLLRAQIKYADKSVNGKAIELDLRRETRGNGKKKTYTREEIDILFVYVPSKEVVLRIPAELIDKKKSITLRFTPTKNGQRYVDANKFIW